MNSSNAPWSKNKKWLFLLTFWLLGISLLGNSIWAQFKLQPLDKNAQTETVILRLANGIKMDHPSNIVAQEVANEIYKKTKGRIQLEIYANMEFGQEIELVNMVKKGIIDFAIVSAGALSYYDAEVNIISLPYLFASEEQANQALDGKPGQAILKSIDENGTVGICFWENGFRDITTADRLVKRPQDMKGLHLRVLQNPIYISFFSRLGTEPTPMDWGEVIPTLQSGIIEAQENPIPIIYNNNLQNYQQYLILTEHIFDPHLVLASNSLQSKLTPDEINLVFSYFQRARIRQRRLITEQNRINLDLLKGKGMVIVKPDINEFRQIGREFSKETIKMFKPEIRKYFERYLQ